MVNMRKVAESLDWRAHLMILLGGEAGLRLGEMVSLRWGDCDLARRTIRIGRNTWRNIENVPKGGKAAVVPMTTVLAIALERAPRGVRVLECDGAVPFNARRLGLLMKRVTTLAGLEPTLGVHKLRHTYCSRLADKGAAPEAIRRLARHKTMSVTMRYVHMDDAALENAVRLLDD